MTNRKKAGKHPNEGKSLFFYVLLGPNDKVNYMYRMKPFYTALFLFVAAIGYGQSYLGRVTGQAGLMKGPGKGSGEILLLKPWVQIFIISMETDNDFYNIIDIATGMEGYVQKEFIKQGDAVPECDKGIFTPNGKAGTYNSEAEIFNDTSITLTLKLNSETYTFAPQQKLTITLSPGTYKYRVSAPGMIPYMGTQPVDSNRAYSWRFFIVTE
ncbi:hypothetical protein CHU92_00895 [Flavobacterium cyanobacteriorum]|uniref:SH3b domain-containing protein n=1 Tax=Flavobacterium cyanobacteriorum TaxID=2022802 RepID=A0A256A4D2_9FLAO|nr:hypothetical protein [Flavobacterium cyanobacteriorum]OYQ47954.1 hypothetical protein CHU92_00895 [Flavobacterium cyanobacteriorum]